MARVLNQETSLSLQVKGLQRERGVLPRLAAAEALLGAILLAAGFLGWGLAARWAGGILLFLAGGHVLRLQEGRIEERNLTAGRRGEARVAEVLQSRLPDTMYVLNDLLLRHGRQRAQVDHVVVAPRGVFALETKSWRGRLEGDEGATHWRQVLNEGRDVRRLGNPVRQTRRHAAVLRDLLRAHGLDGVEVQSVLIFSSPQVSFDIRGRTLPMYTPEEAVAFIDWFDGGRTFTDDEQRAILNALGARP